MENADGCYGQTREPKHTSHVHILIPLLFSFPGALIGVYYLYSQTRNSVQDMDPDSEDTDQLLEDLAWTMRQRIRASRGRR